MKLRAPIRRNLTVRDNRLIKTTGMLPPDHIDLTGRLVLTPATWGAYYLIEPVAPAVLECPFEVAKVEAHICAAGFNVALNSVVTLDYTAKLTLKLK